jgi:hypothetical protein
MSVKTSHTFPFFSAKHWNELSNFLWKILKTYFCNKIASKYVFISFNIKFTNTNPSHSRKIILVIKPSSVLLL